MRLLPSLFCFCKPTQSGRPLEARWTTAVVATAVHCDAMHTAAAREICVVAVVVWCCDQDGVVRVAQVLKDLVEKRPAARAGDEVLWLNSADRMEDGRVEVLAEGSKEAMRAKEARPVRQVCRHELQVGAKEAQQLRLHEVVVGDGQIADALRIDKGRGGQTRGLYRDAHGHDSPPCLFRGSMHCQ